MGQGEGAGRKGLSRSMSEGGGEKLATFAWGTTGLADLESGFSYLCSDLAHLRPQSQLLGCPSEDPLASLSLTHVEPGLSSQRDGLLAAS